MKISSKPACQNRWAGFTLCFEENMKKTTTKPAETGVKKQNTGLPEFLAAAGVILLVLLAVLFIRACSDADSEMADDLAGTEDNVVPSEESPTSTYLDPIPVEGTILPVSLTSAVSVDTVYTATGYFPEDGTDEGVENVLAAKFTNTSDRTLEYMTAVLTVNGEAYNFALTTIPAGASVYVFNTDRKIAPETVTEISAEAGYEIFFAEEPGLMQEKLSFEIQNGTIVVTNISGEDIASDIIVYYKSTAGTGYLGGITYRFTVSGGLEAGQSYNAYAPHAYAHMTEIMFVQCN